MMIDESTHTWDVYVTKDYELSKNSGTEYIGTISLDGHYTEEIEGCWVSDSDSVDFHISCYEHWENDGPTLRIHAGLEDVEDLIIDLEKGLERLNTTV